MELLDQYKRSLKAIEAEELFDLIIYRPLAFLFVKATFALPLTPNQVSVMAMMVGVAGGVFFGLGTPLSLIVGAGCYFLSNVLDCADGQIARLKKNGSRIGRIVDGFIDYVVSIAVFLGIAIALASGARAGVVPPFASAVLGLTDASSIIVYAWVLTALAGASTAYQAFHFDLVRNDYMKFVYGKGSSLETEITEFEEERAMTVAQKKGPGKFIDLLLIDIYLRYTRLQLKSQQSAGAAADIRCASPEAYAQHNKTLLRAWSFVGSTTHITLCVACALAGNLELFLLVTFIPLNLLALTLQVLQARAHRRTFAT